MEVDKEVNFLSLALVCEPIYINMDNLIKEGRESFPISRSKKGPEIFLGMSHYLIIMLAVVHLTFGFLLASNQHVGLPMKCENGFEASCGAQTHYLPIYMDYIQKNREGNPEAPKIYAYFKIAPYVFILFGKFILFHCIDISYGY